MAEDANGVVDGRGEEARNRKSWSDVWAHFERFTGDDGRQRAKCNKCGAELLAETKNGTSRLWQHARHTCQGNDSAPEQQQDARGSHRKRPRSLPVLRESPGASKLPVEEAKADLARMVAFHGHHPSFVQDRYFRSFVGRLNPDFQVPLRFAIEDMCDGVLKEARRDFRSEMDRTSSMVSVAVDTVKIIEGTALYVACHFIDDEWNLRKMIMDEYRLVTDCTYHCEIFGIFEYSLEDENYCSYLAGNMCDDLGGVLDKLFCCMEGEVGNLMDRLYGYITFNPVVHGFTFVDAVLHSIAQCLFDNLETDFHSDVCEELASSKMTRHDKDEFLSKLGINELRPYDQRWFLCYCSLQFLRNNCSEGLEFEALLIKLWGEIYRAIKTVSDLSLPTSHLCLVELFKVRDLLQFELTRGSGDTAPTYEDCRFEKGVEHVLQLAKDKLDSSIEDSYREWSLPLVLDPRYKLRYIEFKFPKVFGTAAVPENNISKVKKFLRKTFEDYDEDDETTDGDPSHVTPLDQEWYEQCRLVDSVTGVAGTELDRYLKDPCVPLAGSFDILNWWKVNSSNYPKVSRMARDALAVPTSNRLSSEQISMIRNGIRLDI